MTAPACLIPSRFTAEFATAVGSKKSARFLGVPFKRPYTSPSTRRHRLLMSSCGQMEHKGTTIARDAVDRAEQLPHTGNERDLRPLARSQQALVVRAQPRAFPDGDQCGHPQPMAQARISERKAPRAGER